uniref:Heat shock protein 90 n=1 Tax=Haplosporidium littoralis TaxID=1296328 RepID=X4ZHM6_9EUKA|nr:heat shock protein 90 [Haplosporidium littoralis]
MVAVEKSANGERFKFDADISKLLGLIIHTFYTNKEVFLRELISNSSDAIDKIRFKALTDSAILGEDTEFRIEIETNKEAKTFTLRDNGIGMTKEDLINNLGTIATSGTKAFMDAIKAGADIQMIGQFGVGFYSAFLVSEKVQVRTKAPNGTQHLWESTAGGEFDVYDDSKNPHQLYRGTEIILHLKEDQLEYLEATRIKSVVHRYIEFLGKKVMLLTTKEVDKDVTDDEGEDEKEKDEGAKVEEIKEKDDSKDDAKTEAEPMEDEKKEDVKIEEVKEDKKKTKTVTEIKREWEQINKVNPVWTMQPKDVTKEEYDAFYKSISNDWEEPLIHKHFHVEGQVEFRGILFIPKRAPFDLFNNQKKQNNIKLYVRKVFINEDSKQLCPEYLSFVRGVVDSEEMPLNISRETLQQNKLMAIIKKNVTKKALELISDLSEDKEKYKKFYESFSKNLKLGVHEDSVNREKLASLLRFHTTKTDKEPKSLAEYVEGIRENQKDIYFITGDSKEALVKLPFLEKLIKKGFEVILMTDPIDEYCVQQLGEFDGHKLVSVTKEGLELPQTEEEKKEFEEKKKDFEPFCNRVKELLTGRVEKVVVTDRMTDSPCYISTGKFGWSARMEQIMRNQALRDSSFTANMASKKTLEINAFHPIVAELQRRLMDDTKDIVAKNLVVLLYESAVLTSGGLTLDNPVTFVERIYKLMELGLNIVDEKPNDDLPPLEEVPKEAPEVEEMEEVD